MPKYVQKHKNTGYEVDGQELARDDAEKAKTARKPETEHTDDLLDEIDEVLEQDENFVAQFRQQGGQ